MKNIFLFIPNYVYITDLLRTGFISELTKDNHVVIYLPTLEYVNTYPILNNVEYKIWNMKSKRFWGYMKLLRVGLIRKFDDLLSIKIHYKVGFSDWRRKILRFIALCVPFKLDTNLFTFLEAKIIKKDHIFAQDVLKYEPHIIAVCSPGFTDFESEIIAQSKRMNIPNIAINFSWDNLTTNAKHLRHTDYLIVWNKFMKDEAIKYHNYTEKEVFISGAMRFDYYFSEDLYKTRDVFLVEKGFDPTLPLVVLTTTSNGVYPFHKDLIKIILEFRDSGKTPDFNFLVRVHPKDDIDYYSEFVGRNNFLIELPGEKRKKVADSRHKIEMVDKDLKNLHATLKYADIVINYTSTITLEALACDTKVINIGLPKTPFHVHYEYIHYKPIIDSGVVPLVHSKEDLLEQINLLLKDKNKVSKKIVDEFFFKTDGKSYKRCADIINNLVNSL